MNDLSQQTEQLLKALTALDTSVTQLTGTTMVLGTVIVALLLVIAFRRHK
jgi:predicted RND superfamily exporter protein